MWSESLPGVKILIPNPSISSMCHLPNIMQGKYDLPTSDSCPTYRIIAFPITCFPKPGQQTREQSNHEQKHQRLVKLEYLEPDLGFHPEISGRYNISPAYRRHRDDAVPIQDVWCCRWMWGHHQHLICNHAAKSKGITPERWHFQEYHVPPKHGLSITKARCMR